MQFESPNQKFFDMNFDPLSGFTDVSNSYQSEVWKHFFKNEMTEKGQCKHCDKILQCRNGGTTALVKHIQNIHPMRTFKKLNRTSNVWKHFVKDDLSETAQCLHCNVMLPYYYSLPTSNLLNVESIQQTKKPLKSISNSSTSNLLKHTRENHQLDFNGFFMYINYGYWIYVMTISVICKILILDKL